MTATQTTTATEAEIRTLVDDRVEAVRAKDVNRLMANHAPGAVSFDAVNPLQYVGLDEMRKRAEEWFSAYQGPIGYEVRELNIAAGNDVAFCHYLYRVSGTMTNGSQVNMWVRATIGFRKIDARWMVTHTHDSVPFDGQTGQASMNLQP